MKTKCFNTHRFKWFVSRFADFLTVAFSDPKQASQLSFNFDKSIKKITIEFENGEEVELK